MRSSIHLMPTLFLLALLGFFALSYLSPASQVLAESGARIIGAAEQADAETPQSPQCEFREVEADEGYGVSHKEIRRICR